KSGNAWCGNRRLSGFGETRAGWRKFGDEHPDVVIVLLASKAAGVNTVYLQRLIGSERRNELALTGVSVERPPVITAFQLLAVKPTIGKRHTAMGASVPQRERAPLTVAAENQWYFQQHCLLQVIATDVVSWQGATPVAEQHQ